MMLYLVGWMVGGSIFASQVGLVEGGRLLSTKIIFQASSSSLADNKHFQRTGIKN
jgi:hypothetical protein